MTTISRLFLIFMALSCFSITGYSEDNSSYHADAIANGKFADAEQGLLAILAKDPNDPYALLNLAYVYQQSGNATKAQQVYQKIIELKSNPYAELTSGKQEPVKNIARRGISQLDAK